MSTTHFSHVFGVLSLNNSIKTRPEDARLSISMKTRGKTIIAFLLFCDCLIQ